MDRRGEYDFEVVATAPTGDSLPSNVLKVESGATSCFFRHNGGLYPAKYERISCPAAVNLSVRATVLWGQHFIRNEITYEDHQPFG
jgi:hypothetical protein